jgi:hypothetical protein
MVRGIERFKVHFAPYIEQYVLIGGTACTLLMQDVGLDFRATRDLDIVLQLERLTQEFVQAFWDFVRAGHYQNRQKSTGKSLFYRFQDPDDQSYPSMLELFSHPLDTLTLSEDAHLTPIPMDGEISSLSAILLDSDYYQLIQTGKGNVTGLPVVTAPYLIPLKAKAWLDLRERRQAGDAVDERSIRKHRNDVFRLYQIVAPDQQILLPDSIRMDLRNFMDKMAGEAGIDLKTMGLRNVRLDELLDTLRMIYDLGD